MICCITSFVFGPFLERDYILVFFQIFVGVCSVFLVFGPEAFWCFFDGVSLVFRTAPNIFDFCRNDSEHLRNLRNTF